jgi:hypothetical protein
MIDPLNPDKTLEDAELGNGDIIVFQKPVLEE